ncbi:acyltransferase family protein [bacterium]|nr:acyltransferase family protein [bacterium]
MTTKKSKKSQLDQLKEELKKLQASVKQGSKGNNADYEEFKLELAKLFTPIISSSLPYVALMKRWYIFIKDYFLPTGSEMKAIDEFGLNPHLIDKLLPILQFLYHQYWRVEIDGIKNIPNSGKGMIVANHSGTIPWDAAMVSMALFNEHPKKRKVRFLVENFAFNIPILGNIMHQVGGIKASRENATMLLNKNSLINIFPEGVKGIGKLYKDRYKLQRFARGGYIRIAIKTRAPIIPCAIIGAEEIHPIFKKSEKLANSIGVPYIPFTSTFPWLGPLGIIPLPSKWKICFGKPIKFNDYPKSSAEDDKLIEKLNCKVQLSIKKMIDDNLKGRTSIWYG